jgi:peptidoglycan/LPS O-acetylase OafA/YrhL
MTSEHSSQSLSWTRLDGVDLLRGLAIFFVLMNHVNMRLLFAGIPYTRSLPKQLVSSLVWNGQFGVQIFFAVSGFLITSTAMRRWGSLSRISVRAFYQLRFARIAPLLLALLAVLSALHLLRAPNFVVSQKTGGLAQALLAALTFHVNVLEARRGYLPGSWDILWSLSVEEMFYLFFPLICRILGGRSRLVALLLLFVVLGPLGRTVLARGNPVWREYSYLGGMDAIALGCLTAIFLSHRCLSQPWLRFLLTSGLVFLIFVLGFSIHVETWGLDRSGLDMSILAIGACMVIVVAAQTKWRSPWVLSPLRMLGRRSYEVYLTHMFVVFACFYIFVRIGTPLQAIPLLFLITILISALLGEMVARLYSESMNRWLRRHWGNGPDQLGSVVESHDDIPRTKELAV